jgi:hypothetical protein
VALTQLGRDRRVLSLDCNRGQTRAAVVLIDPPVGNYRAARGPMRWLWASILRAGETHPSQTSEGDDVRAPSHRRNGSR